MPLQANPPTGKGRVGWFQGEGVSACARDPIKKAAHQPLPPYFHPTQPPLPTPSPLLRRRLLLWSGKNLGCEEERRNCAWGLTASDSGTQPFSLRPVWTPSLKADGLSSAKPLHATCPLHAMTFSCAPRPASRCARAIALIINFVRSH